jgi:phosphoglycerol transferase MdoB-like AlkP superfamily enzyme
MNCNQWPQSDYDMVNATIDDIISQDKFMAYYVSVSGHMTWTFGSNDMSRRNKDAVEDLNVSEEAKAYVAANIELDKALELVVNKLRDANKLDDTVIVVVADHYPYSMKLDTINELSTYERDLRFEVNRSTLILYNSKVEHQVIDKVSTQLDVLPTLYNLFNIKYDSRLIMGKDIFSNSEGIAYFTDRSWITSKGRYNASIGRFIPNDGVEVDNDYVKMINNEVSSRINLSKLIMENDYYRKVLGGE